MSAVPLPDASSRRPGAAREEPVVHLLTALAVAAYAWILHRLIGAIATVSVLAFATALTNMAILAAGGGARLVQVSRWTWLVIVLAALVLIGRPAAERDCRVPTSTFWSLPQLAFCTDHKETIRRSLHARPSAVPALSIAGQARTRARFRHLSLD